MITKLFHKLKMLRVKGYLHNTNLFQVFFRQKNMSFKKLIFTKKRVKQILFLYFYL